MDPPAPGAEKLYGRRKGRPIRARRAALLAERLPALRIDAETPLEDLRALFPAPVARVALEIGFGGGEHLAGLLRDDEALGAIGCEIFLNGVARFVDAIEQGGLGDRARIFADDARVLLRRLPQAQIDRAYLLFPDPWPKTRHAERRFLQPGALDLLAAVLRDGGALHLASDDPGMQGWMLRAASAHAAFAQAGEGWNRPAGEPETRYERKAIAAGRAPLYAQFERLPRALR